MPVGVVSSRARLDIPWGRGPMGFRPMPPTPRATQFTPVFPIPFRILIPELISKVRRQCKLSRSWVRFRIRSYIQGSGAPTRPQGRAPPLQVYVDGQKGETLCMGLEAIFFSVIDVQFQFAERLNYDFDWSLSTLRR